MWYIMQRPSCEYYAYSMLPYDDFKRIEAIDALFQCITRIPHEVHEPSVAHQKCQFYRHDIQHIAEKTARHPSCIALQSSPHTNTLEDWEPILTAIERDIDLIRPHTEQDFKRHAAQQYGAVYQLIARTLKIDLDQEAADQLGYFIAQMLRLQTLHTDPHAQRHIPLEYMTQYSIESWQDKALTPLIQTLIDNANKSLVSKPLTKPFSTLQNLYHDILAKMQANPEAVLTGYVDITSLRKLAMARFPTLTQYIGHHCEKLPTSA